MIWPCPHKVDCVGSDYPLMNVSSEGPDMPQFTAVGFCCNGQQAWSYSLASQVDAEDQLQRLMFLGCPDCSEENSYCADANCPDGTFLARYCLPTSQAEADTLANLHEAAMAPYCDGQLGDLFSATCSCPDGSQSMTAYSEISDADALNACQSVPRDCNVTPATNTQQICFSRCPDGTLFYWVVAAGTFYASTVAEANAMAYAVACQRAQIFRVCISGAVPRACLNNPYNIILTATSGRTYSWNVSGTVPPGLTATPIGQNGLQIQGTPTTAGTYTLVLTATDEVGNYMVKTITITVWGITDTALPDAFTGIVYVYQIPVTGGTAPYTFSIVSGAFPTGLTMGPDGIILGTPTEAGTFTIGIRVVDALGRTCTKELTLTVPEIATYRILYWTMEESLLSDRVDSVESLHAPAEAQSVSWADHTATAIGIDAGAGLFGNGCRMAKGLQNTWINGGFIGPFTTIGRVQVNNSGSLRQDGNGLSFCFWLKVNVLNTVPVFLEYIKNGSFKTTLEFTNTYCRCVVNDTGVVHSENIPLPIPTVGAWTFYELYHDPVAGKMGAVINNSTDYPSSFTPVITASVNGTFTVVMNSTNGAFNSTFDATDAQDFIVDEVLIRMDSRLTVAQRAYLYNGGVGRTWPIVLP